VLYARVTPSKWSDPGISVHPLAPEALPSMKIWKYLQCVRDGMQHGMAKFISTLFPQNQQKWPNFQPYRICIYIMVVSNVHRYAYKPCIHRYVYMSHVCIDRRARVCIYIYVYIFSKFLHHIWIYANELPQNSKKIVTSMQKIHPQKINATLESLYQCRPRYIWFC
jgi:hypothetical protein